MVANQPWAASRGFATLLTQGYMPSPHSGLPEVTVPGLPSLLALRTLTRHSSGRGGMVPSSFAAAKNWGLDLERTHTKTRKDKEGIKRIVNGPQDFKQSTLRINRRL